MKRAAFFLLVLSIAIGTAAQAAGQGAQQAPPPAGQAAPGGQSAPAGQTTPAPAAAAPQAKRPPQAKTTPEYDAWKAADAGSRPTPEEQAAAQKSPADLQALIAAIAARTEKASDDFAVKFPDSEVRGLLYKTTMRLYQNANNADKVEAMGRKALAQDGDDPEALVSVAEIIAERTRDSDIDKDQRFDEAMKMAQKATQTIDTNLVFNPGTPQDRIDAAKAELHSRAYSVMGAIDFKKDNFASAEINLQKSIDAYPQQPDPYVVLKMAIALDKQEKYAEALKVANRAVEMTKETDQAGIYARRERDRLQQLTGGATPPAPAQAQPPKN